MHVCGTPLKVCAAGPSLPTLACEHRALLAGPDGDRKDLASSETIRPLSHTPGPTSRSGIIERCIEPYHALYQVTWCTDQG